jgi:hypothetical protein
VREDAVGRIGAAEELVGPVLFLLSDAASFITGSIFGSMAVDGVVEAVKRACVVIRVDSGTRIGAGHLMRCLSLASSCVRSDPTFTSYAVRDGHLQRTGPSEGFALHCCPYRRICRPRTRSTGTLGSAPWERDSEEVAPILRVLKPAWLVVDH